MLPFVWNIFKSYRYGEVVVVDDPWGYGNSLEWVTTCPPPRHNFTELPRIRSERPAFELHYPHMADRMRAEAHVGRHEYSNLAAKAQRRLHARTTPPADEQGQQVPIGNSLATDTAPLAVTDGDGLGGPT